MKKTPMRRCVVTGEVLPKNDLLRIVRTPSGDVQPDLTGKLNGRGAYIKKDIDVLTIAKKKGILQKNLNCEINEEVFQAIAKVING